MPNTPPTEPPGPLDPPSLAPPPLRLTMDRDGGWAHEGAPILHPQLRRLLDRSITIGPEGEVEVRVGEGERVERALVTVEDLPYQVREVQLKPSGELYVCLNDESREEITPDALWVVGDDALYCRVKGGRYPARFLRHPYISIASRFEEDEAVAGGFVLPLSGRRWPITRQDEPPSWP